MDEFYSYTLDWLLLFVCTVCLSHEVFYILEHIMLLTGSIEQITTITISTDKKLKSKEQF